MATRSFRWVDAEGAERTLAEDELKTRLASGDISKSSLVSETGTEAWVRADEVPGLTPPPADVFVPPPPAFIEAVQRTFEGADEPPTEPVVRKGPGGTLIAAPAVAAPPPRVGPGGTLVAMPAPARLPPPSAPPPGAIRTLPLPGSMRSVPPAVQPPSDRPDTPSTPPMPPRPRRALLLPVVGGLVGLVVFVGLFAAIRGSGKGSDTAVATAPSSTVARPAASTAPVAPPSSTEGLVACKVTKGPSRIALRASKDVPIELAGVPAKSRVALGFSPDGRTARGLMIDPATLLAKPEIPPRVLGLVKRVTPVPMQDGARWVVDAELPKAATRQPMSVAVEPPYTVAIADDALVVVGAPGETPRKLWALPAGADAFRSLPLADAGALVALRATDGVYVGRVGTDRTPRGELVKVSEAGQVGTPALGTNGVEIAVSFAWRASPSDPWTLRLSHGARGDDLKTASAFPLPPGGPGGDAFAPTLAGMSDGRWLIAWTEGTTGNRAVRAITLSPTAQPFGAALVLSAGVASAGQANLAMLGGDAGLAVFLTTPRPGLYDLWGASLSCS